MKRKFLAACLAAIMVLNLCGSAMAYESAEWNMNADVPVDSNESAYYIDTEGNKCYFRVEMMDDKIIVTDDFATSTLNLKNSKLTTKIFDTGLITSIDVDVAPLRNEVLQAPNNGLRRKPIGSFYATVRFKPVIDSLGYTHNNSLNIYSDNLGTQKKQDYVLQSAKGRAMSEVLSLIVAYFTGSVVSAIIARFSVALEVIGGKVGTFLISEGVIRVTNGIITQPFSTTLQATETLYEVQAVDTATNRESRIYKGGKYLITEKGKYLNQIFYAGYYPQFVENVNNDTRLDRSVAYWIYSDFWDGAFNGIA